MNTSFLVLKNCTAAPLASLPCPEFSEFRKTLIQAVAEKKMRVSSFFALQEKEGHKLIAVLADDASSSLCLISAVVGSSYESLTKECPQFHWFEREIAEQSGIMPLGHPWLKPIRFHKTMNGAPDVWGRAGEPVAGVTDYFTMKGSAAHEVAVGPVHAGVIEPGHFRFQCMGEDVYSLEIELGYQHRGIEKMLIGGPDKRTIDFMETAAGDSTAASASAYAGILEALTGTCPPERAQALRAFALELERIANHVGDLGALAGDVAFLPTASYCGRIRGEYLNMTAEFCGNRFGRTLILPGGIRYDLEPERIAKLAAWLDRIRPELMNALELMFDAPSVLDRLENTGTVSAEDCSAIGMVGVAARACGAALDVRRSHPYGFYEKKCPSEAEVSGGDVFARAKVRYQEIKASEAFVRTLAEALPAGRIHTGLSGEIAPDSIAVSLVEAWRGEMCHAARGRTENSGVIRLSIRRFTTGSGWRWRFAGNRFQTSPSAIKVSICPTADTIFEESSSCSVYSKQDSFRDTGPGPFRTRRRSCRNAFSDVPWSIRKNAGRNRSVILRSAPPVRLQNAEKESVSTSENVSSAGNAVKSATAESVFQRNMPSRR